MVGKGDHATRLVGPQGGQNEQPSNLREEHGLLSEGRRLRAKELALVMQEQYVVRR